MRRFNLQLFADGGEEGTGTTGTERHETGYSFEQAEEIATARAERATKAALQSYFRQQGMTEEEAQEAFKDYKNKKEAQKPDIAAVTKERDEAVLKVKAYENEKLLRQKNVREDDIDYVTYKVNQMVTDKVDFGAAADKFLKDNPRYKNTAGYRVSTGVQSGSGETRTKSEQISDALKEAFRAR